MQVVAPEREIMSWSDLGTGSRELAEAMHADDWIPDLVLGISRGGLPVAGALAYALGVKNTATISVEFYTGVDERLDLPMLLPPVPDLVDLRSARVLIADDVADTGATLELVRDFCVGRVAEARVAVLYEKSRSTVASEYVWRRTDRWITFPWSALPPVTGGTSESHIAVGGRSGPVRGRTHEPKHVSQLPRHPYNTSVGRTDPRSCGIEDAVDDVVDKGQI